VLQPLRELERVADRGRKQQQANVRRQQAQSQFPNDAALGISEVVELVHDDGGDVGEVEGRRQGRGGFRVQGSGFREARGRRSEVGGRNREFRLTSGL